MEKEIEKLNKVKEDSQKIGLFLDWLRGQNLELCKMHYHDVNCKNEVGDNYCGFHEHEYVPTRITIEQLLATYFEIDLKKVEEEKLKILEELEEKDK